MRPGRALLGLQALLILGCAVDERELTVADDGVSSAGEEAPAMDVTVRAPEAPPSSALPETSSAAASSAAADACAGLPEGRCECVTGASSTCGAEYVTLGSCATRPLVCQAPGTWPPASECAPVGPELCDPGAVDDDCNGEIDEGCACINTAVEVCDGAPGAMRVCVGGAWGPCQCALEEELDIDQNGVADSAETLLSNGTFTGDLAGWVQSEADAPGNSRPLFERADDDATQLACSGSMLLISWENSGDNFAEQCVTATSDSYVASAQVLLVANAGFGDTSSELVTTNFDPSVMALELAALASSDCTGTPLTEELASTTLDPFLPSWQLLRVSMAAPAGTQSLRLRLRVVADAESGQQSYEQRAARWDNVVLHAS